jgi:hypothetical protein
MSHNQNTNEKKMNFVIRLDAGTPIGNGHLMRIIGKRTQRNTFNTQKSVNDRREEKNKWTNN